MPIKLSRPAALALSAALLLSTAPVAFADDDHPTTLQAAPATSSSAMPTADASGITHITGGVGEDERDAIEAARADYNVHITNSNKDGAFNDQTTLTFTDKSGTELLTADAGPLFFVTLPPGSYTITAQHRERQQVKKLKITKSKKVQPDLHFVW